MQARENEPAGTEDGVVSEEREPASGSGGTVELTIPAQPELLQLVRMTAAVVAARAEFALEDIEDLRLAVDELCLPLMGPAGHDGTLSLRYRWDEGSIAISCRCPGGGGPRPALSSQILDALVDEHGEKESDGAAEMWLTMERDRPSAGDR